MSATLYFKLKSICDDVVVVDIFICFVDAKLHHTIRKKVAIGQEITRLIKINKNFIL